MTVTPEGISMDLSDEQLLNTALLRMVSPSGSSMAPSDVHPEKASAPIEVTVAGTSIDSSPEQLWNMPGSISVSESGHFTDFTLAQP